MPDIIHFMNKEIYFLLSIYKTVHTRTVIKKNVINKTTPAIISFLTPSAHFVTAKAAPYHITHSAHGNTRPLRHYKQ